MNKFKKIVVGAVAAAGVACLGGAVACTQDAPKYYSLSFEGNVEFVMHDALAVPDGDNNPFTGGTVKEGVEVKFSLVLATNKTGNAVVKLNGETLQPIGDNLYSFIMTGDSKVEVTGINTVYDLTLGKYEKKIDATGQDYTEERRVTYLDENGKELGEHFKVEGGSDFKFKLRVSSYYIKKKDADGNPVYEDDPNYANAKLAYTVRYNYEILEPDANGVYTIKNITDSKDVDILGLEQEPSFVEREDGGSGTESDPFILKRPIDLFTMAALVNSSMYTNYGGAYYKLAEDVDMDGEQMFVVGDASSNTAMFYGHFDGNGKTVSNFYITDEVIDQTEFTEAYLPYVGFFGYATASRDSAAVIKDLHLKDYRVNVHPAAAGAPSYAGSLVGFGIGVQVSGCSVENGTVTAIGDDNQMIYMGGVIGLMQAAYNANGGNGGNVLTFDSYLSSTWAKNISVQGTGSPRSAGGLVGYAVSSDINAISYIVNCSVTGSVSAGMHVGGVVGTLGRFSTVTNSYSKCDLSADNGINGLVPAEYMCAFAGGIAGYAEEDSVIASCYSDAGQMFATSAHGSSYENTDKLLGGKSSKGNSAVDSAAVILYNNRVAAAGDTSAVFTDADKLGWNTLDWEFAGNVPQVKPNGGKRQITVNVYLKGASATGAAHKTFTKSISSELLPVYGWFNDGTMPEYLTSAAGRSWGYYFDAECTQKVPYGFIPSAAVTNLYVGYADYSEVAGRYYLKSTTYSDGAYIDLSADGSAFIRSGGLNFNCTFSYDGENITIFNSCLASLIYTSAQVDGGYFTVIGTATEEGFTLNGKAVLASTGSTSGYETVEFTLVAVSDKADKKFCGEYSGDNGATYVFNRDLSGVYRPAVGASQNFTYTVNANVITITLAGGGVWEATVASDAVAVINGVAVTKKDVFAGSWQTSANSQITFTFDGLGGVKYAVAGGQTVETTGTAVSGRLTFRIDETEYEAWFDAEGFLIINGVRYSKADGFTGSWYFIPESIGNDDYSVKERIDVVFEGIGAEGFGYASITYSGGTVTTINAQYDIFGSRLRLFAEDVQYADLAFDAATGTITGGFYSLNGNRTIQTGFYLYDAVKGTWACNTDGINTVTFNGKAGNDAEIVIRGDDNSTRRGTYTFSGSTGTATVGGINYTIAFDESAGRITLSKEEGTDSVLAKLDAWRGVVLYDGDTSYSFNGKGYLVGTVTISGGQTVSYTVDGNGDVYIGQTKLEKTALGFKYGNVNLVFKTGFANQWMVSGTQEKLTIGEVGGDFTAQVSYSGESGTFAFTYNPADNTLSHTETVNGERIVTTLKLNGNSEMSISRGTTYLNCTTVSNADGWQGVYVSDDGSGWTFDGLGKCRYGSGTAVFTNASGLSAKYSYKINAIGLPEIKMAVSEVFTLTDKGGYKKDGGPAYDTAVPDALYCRRVVTSGAVWYAFDGAGTLWIRQGDGSYATAYKYTIVDADNVTLTDANGATYTGKLVEDGANTRIDIEEIAG